MVLSSSSDNGTNKTTTKEKNCLNNAKPCQCITKAGNICGVCPVYGTTMCGIHTIHGCKKDKNDNTPTDPQAETDWTSALDWLATLSATQLQLNVDANLQVKFLQDGSYQLNLTKINLQFQKDITDKFPVLKEYLDFNLFTNTSVTNPTNLITGKFFNLK